MRTTANSATPFPPLGTPRGCCPGAPACAARAWTKRHQIPATSHHNTRFTRFTRIRPSVKKCDC
eukprot:1154864-Pelagomonas_calceolata.AAC.1